MIKPVRQDKGDHVTNYTKEIKNPNFGKWSVEIFLMAFSLLFIEVLFFKTALYIRDYLNALLTVSYALSGLAIGAVIAHFCRRLSEMQIFFIKFIFIVSILLSFLNFIYFSNILFLSPVLILPFSAGNIMISYFLKQYHASRVYFFDLTGAAAGVISSLAFIPLLREENCFILVITVTLISSCFNLEKRKAVLIPVMTAAVISLGLLGYNLRFDPINLARITRVSPDGLKDKIFFYPDDFKILHSKGSNVQRIEVLSPAYAGFEETDRPPLLYTAYNGLINDVVRPEPYTSLSYRYDPRVIYGLVQAPDFLVIGASAEGVVKTGAAHGGTVTGLEINPQIIDLMKGPLFSYSRDAYELLDRLYEMDARTYLHQHDTRFDIITLMNSHMARQSGIVGSPEFLHTREAVHAYLDHLTDEGLVIFEEKYYGNRGRMSSLKIINTIMSVLRSEGIQSPEDHLLVYHWILNGLSILGDPGQPSVFHVMIVAKKMPFTEKDRSAIDQWAGRVEYFYGRTHEIKEIYPLNEDASPFTDAIHAFIGKGTKPGPGPELSTVDLSVITDDKPFPWSVDKDHDAVKSLLFKTGGLCLILLAVLGFFYGKYEKAPSRPGFLIPAAYFGLIGLGYFILEIGLMNFYQIYMGSPTYAFIFILATLLFSSGLGSYFSHRMKTAHSLSAFLAIFLICAFHLFAGRKIPAFLGADPLINSIIIAATVFPLGFFMGIPFPFGLELAKKRFGETSSVLLFAVNCLFSAFAVVFSFFLSVIYGFKITFAIGAGLYLMASFIPAAMRSIRRNDTITAASIPTD